MTYDVFSNGALKNSFSCGKGCHALTAAENYVRLYSIPNAEVRPRKS